jgi:hypothetical protein
MKLLTQRNVIILAALEAAWGVWVSTGVIPHAHWMDVVHSVMVAVDTFLAALGFNRTPNGNRLSPDIIAHVDRTAMITTAETAIVEAATDKIVEDTKDKI